MSWSNFSNAFSNIGGAATNFLSGLFGGGQGGAGLFDLSKLPEGMGQMPVAEAFKNQEFLDFLNPQDAGGIFGSAGNFLGKNMAPLGNLYFGAQALGDYRKNNNRAFDLATHQQRMSDLNQQRMWDTYRQNEDERIRGQSSYANLRKIGPDGEIYTTEERPDYRMPVDERLDRLNRIA
jgi:hypothetical protein